MTSYYDTGLQIKDIGIMRQNFILFLFLMSWMQVVFEVIKQFSGLNLNSYLMEILSFRTKFCHLNSLLLSTKLYRRNCILKIITINKIMLLLSWCILRRNMTASRRSSHSCTGWRCRSGFEFQMAVLVYRCRHSEWLRRTSLPNFTGRSTPRPVCQLSIVNHRRSSFSSCGFPALEWNTLPQNVGAVTDCF